MKPTLLSTLCSLSLAAATAGALAATAAAPADSGPQAAQAVDQAKGDTLRADMPSALKALKAAPVAQFNAKDAAFRSCMLKRHDRSGAPAPVEPDGGLSDPMVRALLASYQRYWWRSLRDVSVRPAAEKQLKTELAGLLGEAPPAEGEEAFDALNERLDAELGKRGVHAQLGRTPPLYDLLLWRAQEQRDYVVDLPGGARQPVRVFLMDDWISRGWIHYGICGAGGAGGWANADGVFAVRANYGDLQGEDYRVSLLGHESQHYADQQRWPDMLSWQLEYRAKLVELAQADQTRDTLLGKFYRSRDDNPDHPHPYSNKRVLSDVATQLGLGADADLRMADPAAVRRAAAEVLAEDTRRREADGHGAAPAKAKAAPSR